WVTFPVCTFNLYSHEFFDKNFSLSSKFNEQNNGFNTFDAIEDGGINIQITWSNGQEEFNEVIILNRDS
ncbi:hypothetical protein, partial [Paenibacillus sp. 32O-W]|uniref:hypothetical protein n=1 Tax=Paenibacillus sp. 32O-W TaxID=1695218 RepID=UPI001C930C7B